MNRRVSPGLLLLLMGLILTGPPANSQSRLDIFVTPIPNAPFSGTVSVERRIIGPNGAVIALKTVRGIGRDSKGRIFNEVRALVPSSTNVPPLLTGIHLYDPQTRISTMLDPRQKTYQSGLVNRPPATEPPGLDFASPSGGGRPPSPYTTEEDLGTRNVNHVALHGVRETQTIPAEQSGTGQAVVVTDEYWYSADLHMNLALRHDDPRTGSVTMAVTQVTLAEPDAGLFEIPEGYQRSDGSSPGKPAAPGGKGQPQ